MNKKYFLKLSLLLSGNIFAAFGVFLCSISHKGVDPITVLFEGIMNTFNVSIGVASLIFHSTLVVICYLIDKKSIKFGTIFSIISFSLCLNLFMTRYSLLTFFAQTKAAWVFLIFGIIFMGIGFSIGIFANIGYNTADIALNILTSKTKLNIKICKSIIDFTCATLGFILGGRIGIGTVLCVIFVGIIYSTTLNLLENTKIKNEQFILINENS